jgi:CRP-like cAMP-binding protein
MDSKNWLVTSGICSAIERKLVSGQTLFSQGQHSACLYEVVSGKIRLSCVDTAGREVVLGFASEGNTIGEASLFSSIYHCNAVATAPAVVRIYQKATLLAEFAHNPKAAQAFMARCAPDHRSTN